MTPLAHEIRAEAKSLADRITNAEFAALTEGQRIDLRTLTLRMAGWADAVEEMDAPPMLVDLATGALRPVGNGGVGG